MKIKVWSLAWDTDFGTDAEIYATEAEALEALFNMAIGDHVEPEDLARVRANFDEDPYEVVHEYKKDMDTFTHGSHEVDIDLWDFIKIAMKARVSALAKFDWLRKSVRFGAAKKEIGNA